MKNLTNITNERIEFCQTWLYGNKREDYLAQQDVAQFDKKRSEFLKSLNDWKTLKCFIEGSLTAKKHTTDPCILKTLQDTLFRLRDYFYENDVKRHTMSPEGTFTYQETFRHFNWKQEIDRAIEEVKKKWSYFLV